jgi:hypothetical protein
MIPYKFKQILAIDFIAFRFQIKDDIKAPRKGEAEGLVKMPL